MANENMVVIGAVARKGGSGKSMMMKALASAILADGRTVRLIDTDPQGDMTLWFARAKEGGMAPSGASIASVQSSTELEAEIAAAEDDGTIDFVLVDTAGQAGIWSDQIAMVSDVLITPVVATETDFKIGAQTVEWFKGLHQRVPNPENLPPHRVIVTNFPAKATKRQVKLLKDSALLFPMLNNVIQHRSAYHEMDAQGFLSEILQRVEANPNALQRVHARLYQEALVEATDVLNDILNVLED